MSRVRSQRSPTTMGACVLALVIGVGCASKATSDVDEINTLAREYANYEPWCDKAAKCKQQDVEECLKGDVSAAEARAALVDLKLERAQITDCREAVEELDRCALKLSCGDFDVQRHSFWQDDELRCFDADGVAGECPQKVPCAAQARSFDERCAPLIAYEEPSPSSAEGADAGLGPALPSEDASGAAMSASVSRSLPHVLLFSDAEQGNAGFLYDPELQQLAIELHGGWYTYDDVNDCPEEKRTGTIMPPPSQLFVMSSYADSEGVTPPPEGTTPNEFGLRFWGTQHELWGAGAGVAFDNPGRGPQPYDVTKTGATGIRFWAKSALGELDLKVKLEDQYSEPEASPQLCCFLDPNACGTNGCGVDGDVQGCYFAPFVSVSLDTEWQLVTLPFASFAREAGGSWADGEDHTGEPLTLDGVYQLQFEVGTGDFDVWLDNVGFTVE